MSDREHLVFVVDRYLDADLEHASVGMLKEHIKALTKIVNLLAEELELLGEASPDPETIANHILPRLSRSRGVKWNPNEVDVKRYMDAIIRADGNISAAARELKLKYPTLCTRLESAGPQDWRIQCKVKPRGRHARVKGGTE